MNDSPLSYYAFLYFYHSDCANAAIHMADPKFSPITFDMAKDIGIANMVRTPEIDHVLSHVGAYEPDPGR